MHTYTTTVSELGAIKTNRFARVILGISGKVISQNFIFKYIGTAMIKCKKGKFIMCNLRSNTIAVITQTIANLK